MFDRKFQKTNISYGSGELSCVHDSHDIKIPCKCRYSLCDLFYIVKMILITFFISKLCQCSSETGYDMSQNSSATSVEQLCCLDRVKLVAKTASLQKYSMV